MPNWRWPRSAASWRLAAAPQKIAALPRNAALQNVVLRRAALTAALAAGLAAIIILLPGMPFQILFPWVQSAGLTGT